MATALPQLARAHQPARQQRGLPRQDGGSTSLPVLPHAVDQAGPLVHHELRHVHRHYHMAIGAPEPLREVPAEMGSEQAGSPKSSSSRPSPANGRARKVLIAAEAREESSRCSATMNTGQLLLDAELPDSSASSAAAGEELHSRRRQRGKGGRRSQSAPRVEEMSETERQWGRCVRLEEASRPVLGRRPLWARAPDGEDGVDRRMREMDAEGQWLQQRGEFKKKFKALPDSHEKRRLVGDPRLRNVSDARVIEKIKQEDIAKSRQAARTIRGAMQDCSKSRQQLKSMQMLLRGVESEELQRQRAAAAFFLGGEEGPMRGLVRETEAPSGEAGIEAE